MKTHGKSNTKLYRVWNSMKQRCLNPKDKFYFCYGGRGINICSEWLDQENGFINFYNWAIENGYKEGLTIDRIDNDGDYCPENCRWISVSENSRKKRTTKIDIATAQEIRTRINENWHDLAREYGCTHGNIWFIMNNFTHVPEGECIKKIKGRRNKKQ